MRDLGEKITAKRIKMLYPSCKIRIMISILASISGPAVWGDYHISLSADSFCWVGFLGLGMGNGETCKQ